MKYTLISMQLGLAYEEGKGVPMDLAVAASFYEWGCKAGSAHGCGSFGGLLYYGHGPSSDPDAALQSVELGCDGRYGHACANLGIIYALGRHVPVDAARSAAYLRRGCDLGSELACSSIADRQPVRFGLMSHFEMPGVVMVQPQQAKFQ